VIVLDSTDKEIQALEEAGIANFEDFILVVGMTGLASDAIEKLNQSFNGDVEQFREVVGMGFNFSLIGLDAIDHQEIYNWFGNGKNIKRWNLVYDKYTANNSKYETHVITQPLFTSTNKLSGMDVVITGTLPVDRSIAEAYLSRLGATFKKSISGRTDYLIVGNNPGATKIQAARDRGIPQISSDEFMDIVDRYF